MASNATVLGIRGFSAIAASLALYLLTTSLDGSHVAGCGGGSGCDDVLASQWATFLGLPVSALGLALYSAITFAAFWVSPPTPRRSRRRAWIFLGFSACLVLGAAAWFVALQLFVLEHWCPYCLGAHLAAVLTAALIVRATGNPLRRPPVR